ncbi:hypothetical protein MNBD_GAMMA12-3179 [hydrothermal vent metagenome]|uniref:Uncharacterized protein n=1 Tax=hydrothermal vent metagenome TaxID=652676 RepID=A0A3B0YMG9_9ZZZZ
MIVNEDFRNAIFNPENIAERALVSRLVDGVNEIAGNELPVDKILSMIDLIIKDPMARQSHCFYANDFRDHVRESIQDKPVIIDADDDAFIRLGLGWQTRKRSEGSEINGKDACTYYLNSIVENLENEIRNELHEYNRYDVIQLLLGNHESAFVVREWWRRTSAAMIALRSDKAVARSAISKNESELNAVLHSTRIIIEIAMCESPITGGGFIGQLGMSRLMAKVLLANNLAGYSDAIRWDVMEPRVLITSLGDIHMNFDFFDNVVSPFGRYNMDESINSYISDYSMKLELPESYANSELDLEEEFCEAWRAEMGATVGEFRLYIDFIEDMGINENKAIISKPKSNFINAAIEENIICKEAVEAILKTMTLLNHSNSKDIPDGFNYRDRQFWRFKRRLSILRRPFIQLETDKDPILIVAPGLVRDSVRYMLQNYYSGGFAGWQLQTSEMRRWVGKSMHKRGTDFSIKVSESLSKLGWNTELELPVTKLLRMGFDTNYGDIDVLAWNYETKRILLIECKDVQFRKTPSEIAEQLADFRGVINDNGKPDYLLKHLNRIKIITTNYEALLSYAGMDVNSIIEGHLIFKNAVPMQYAWEHMKEICSISIHSDLEDFQI